MTAAERSSCHIEGILRMLRSHTSSSSSESRKWEVLDSVAITTHFSVKVPTLRVSGSELVPLNPTVDVPGGQPRFFLVQSDLEEVLMQLTQLSIDSDNKLKFVSLSAPNALWPYLN